MKTTEGKTVGVVERCIFDTSTGGLWGVEVSQRNVIKQSRGVMLVSIIGLSPVGVVIDKPEDLQKDMTTFRQRSKLGGVVIGLGASTESGRSLGDISDLLIDADSGYIVRLVLRKILQERIIPRQFVVAITDKKVIFQDSVEKPTFDQLATHEALAEPAL